ncbi:helix-turn-helix domain-containing protein [Clostridium coskatii]|uniref:HTH-type transcriptional regulator Xre n=1 Tax=Clostridium coskatii TaxID=1705578 RepID=A0A162NB90_9CLOT|nr:helix-turn-helix transcriptional regulator [Clostridium coskatii]OAA91309.1 HTH-type transcriptional regulator Xre [Clostridium coskatii]OBR93941.1 HTH-type transcriptional regulator Xre [Clostridium coskatii]
MGLNEIIKIGDKIKSYRKNLKLTQADMAHKLNIPRSTYAHYENNTREPDIDILNEIAKTLNVDITDLISYEFEEKMNAEVSKDIDNIMKKYPKHKEKILDIRRTMDNIIIAEFYKAVTFKDNKITNKTLSNNLELYRELIWTIFEFSNESFIANSNIIENKDFYKLYSEKDKKIKTINDILDKIFTNYLIRYGLVDDGPKESDLKFDRDPNLP